MNDQNSKDKLIEAAGSLFAKLGYEGASVRSICKEAGFSQVAINYHFGSKENLYKECVRAATIGDAADVLEVMPAFLDKKVPAEQRLRFLIEKIMDCFHCKGVDWRNMLMMREMMSPSDCCSDIFREMFDFETQVIQGILGDLLPAQAPQHVKLKFHLSIIGQAHIYSFAHPLIGWMVDEDSLQTHFDSQKLTDHIYSVTMAGIKDYCDSLAGSGS